MILCGVIILSAFGFFSWLVSGSQIEINAETIQELRHNGENVIVLKPKFTESAYSKDGFYAYYNKKCNESCLEIPIRDATKNVGLAYNYNTIKLFKKLNYPIMEDVNIHKELLQN